MKYKKGDIVKLKSAENHKFSFGAGRVLSNATFTIRVSGNTDYLGDVMTGDGTGMGLYIKEEDIAYAITTSSSHIEPERDNDSILLAESKIILIDQNF